MRRLDYRQWNKSAEPASDLIFVSLHFFFLNPNFEWWLIMWKDVTHHKRKRWWERSEKKKKSSKKKLYPFLILKIGNSRALLLYSSDSPPTTSPANNLISIQLDSITLSKIIADSEALGKLVKKINFRDVNGFTELVNGESSKFSFFDDGGRSVCDVSCDVRCKEIPTPQLSSPKPFATRKTHPTYLPPATTKQPIISKKDEAIRPDTTTTTQRTFPSTTRLAPTTERFVPTTSRIISTTRSTTVRATASTTQKATRPALSITRPRSTPGPTYLPVSKISTAKRLTVTERSYPPATWPSTTRHYTQTFPTWSAPIRRSTSSRVYTTTAKYLYKEPSNSLIYVGEDEWSNAVVSRLRIMIAAGFWIDQICVILRLSLCNDCRNSH